jgi:RNA polymerase sigma-B factor
MAPTTFYPTHEDQATDQRDLDHEVDDLAARLADETDPDRRAELVELIVLKMLPLADGLAMRYSGRGVETDDLLQVARVALVKAVDRYRPGAGPGFAAFAHPTISGELKRWFRDHGWAVRPPRRIQELRADLVVEEERLRHALRRDPRDAELADVLGVSVAEVDEARGCSAGYHAVSLDAPTSAGTNLADYVLITSSHAGTVEVRDALRQSLSHLTERQRLVLRLRYVDELTQGEIGDLIGVSQMQVSRILRGIVDRLRCELLADDERRTHGSAA